MKSKKRDKDEKRTKAADLTARSAGKVKGGFGPVDGVKAPAPLPFGPVDSAKATTFTK